MNNTDIAKSKEQLISELNTLRGANMRLKKDLMDIKDYYKDFDDYFELKERLERTEKELAELKEELTLRRKVDGRPSKFTKEQKQEIRELRKNGMAISKIAEQYNCSTSVIHNLVKDIKIDLRKNSRK